MATDYKDQLLHLTYENKQIRLAKTQAKLSHDQAFIEQLESDNCMICQDSLLKD